MSIKMERTLFKVGDDSYAITLPKAWVTTKQLKHGDMLELLIDDDVVIRTKTDTKNTVEGIS